MPSLLPEMEARSENILESINSRQSANFDHTDYIRDNHLANHHGSTAPNDHRSSASPNSGFDDDNRSASQKALDADCDALVLTAGGNACVPCV